jgi:hypothetical protein
MIMMTLLRLLHVSKASIEVCVFCSMVREQNALLRFPDSTMQTIYWWLYDPNLAAMEVTRSSEASDEAEGTR